MVHNLMLMTKAPICTNLWQKTVATHPWLEAISIHVYNILSQPDYQINLEYIALNTNDLNKSYDLTISYYY